MNPEREWLEPLRAALAKCPPFVLGAWSLGEAKLHAAVEAIRARGSR
jgi:hypothetical protein